VLNFSEARVDFLLISDVELENVEVRTFERLELLRTVSVLVFE
jgi:hypothetical protein